MNAVPVVKYGPLYVAFAATRPRFCNLFRYSVIICCITCLKSSCNNGFGLPTTICRTHSCPCTLGKCTTYCLSWPNAAQLLQVYQFLRHSAKRLLSVLLSGIVSMYKFRILSRLGSFFTPFFTHVELTIPNHVAFDVAFSVVKHCMQPSFEKEAKPWFAGGLRACHGPCYGSRSSYRS